MGLLTSDMAGRTRDAVEAGEPLHLAVALRYRFGGSDKYYDVMLVGCAVLVRFGRVASRGEVTVKVFATPVKAASHYWKLLRDKTAKGYAVLDAMVIFGDPAMVKSVREETPGSQWQVRAARTLLEDWERLYREHGPRDWSIPGRTWVPRSPRTPTQGRELILGLVSPEPAEEVLLACVLASDSEVFLRSLALSHPRCSDSAWAANGLFALSREEPAV